MNKKNTCMVLSTILVLLSLISDIMSIELNIIIGIISVPVLIFASMYSKEYKNENGKSPNGIGLIELGVILNIIFGILSGTFNTMGNLFVLIGLIMFLLSKKQKDKFDY